MNRFITIFLKVKLFVGLSRNRNYHLELFVGHRNLLDVEIGIMKLKY